MKKLFYIVGIWSLVIGILATPALGLLRDYRLTPYDLTSGSRPLSMGGAFVGLADDVNTAFYNPGGLPWVKGISFSLRNVNNLSATQAYPTGFGTTYGISVVQKGYTGIIITGSTQEVDFSSNVLVFSAATKLSVIPPLKTSRINKLADSLGVGANLKVLLGQSFRRTGELDRSASGWEADLGLFFKPQRWLSFGATLNNCLGAGWAGSGGYIIWDNDTKEGAPLVYKLGGAAKVFGDIWSPVYWENNELTFVFQLTSQSGVDGGGSLGLEWANFGQNFLRTGYEESWGSQNFSFGGGLRRSSWGVDLTYYTDPVKSEGGLYISILYIPEEWLFERKEEKQYPKIKLNEPIRDLHPADETVTFEDSITVSGEVKARVEVFVNSKRVEVDEQRRFTAKVPLQTGKNLIVIDCYYEGGRLSVNRRVLRKPKIIIQEEEAIKTKLKQARTFEEKAELLAEKEKLDEDKRRLENLSALGVVEVSAYKPFSLESAITRGELASWLAKAAKFPLFRVTYDLFKDVPKNHPQAPFIKAVVSRSIMRGYSDGTFRPDAAVSEAEAKDVFMRFGVIK